MEMKTCDVKLCVNEKKSNCANGGEKLCVHKAVKEETSPQKRLQKIKHSLMQLFENEYFNNHSYQGGSAALSIHLTVFLLITRHT